MFKTTFFKVLLVGAIVIAIGALLYAEFYRPAFAPAVITNEEVTSDETNVENVSKIELEVPEDLIESGPTLGYTLAFSDEKQSLWIYKDGTLLESIPVNTLPARAGSAYAEENEYEYYVRLSTSTPTLYDSNGGLIYFVVTNRTTAGNINAEKTLYAYNVSSKKVAEIYSDFGGGMSDLALSPSGTYFVFSSGSHGGWCNSFYNLAIFDLQSGSVVQNTTSPNFSGGTTGFASFLKWESDTVFTYEADYRSVEECLAGDTTSSKETVEVRTHRIK